MNDDSYLDDLLDQWEDATEQGKSVELQSLCKDRPDLLDKLERKIAAIIAMDAKLNKIDGTQVARTISNQNGSTTSPRPRGPKGPKQITFDTTLSDLRYHARGGIGIVYQGHENALNRYVALKFINSRSGKDSKQCAKFKQEAEITARLDHPGVVPVYAIGESATGQPFYAMRFIQGDSLDKVISQFHSARGDFSFEENRVKENQILRQLVSACRTIAYAHTRGIVHRDIKPQNIMLGKYGETLVVDWGLALPIGRADVFRVEHENTLRPETAMAGANMADGTPVYMSPEQAAGKNTISPASDIYSLGATLYRMITGKLAVEGDTLTEIKKNVIEGIIKPPRELDSSISKDMESICMKALATKPEDRYETAEQLADDIERWMAEVPVMAHAYSAVDKAMRWSKKKASLVRTLAASLLVLTAASLIASGIVWQISQSNIRLQGDASAAFSIARRNQRDNLKLLCQMTARSIQYELQSRIVALDEVARMNETIQLMSETDGEVRETQLNEILETYRCENQSRINSNSWFVLDAEGKLIARSSDNPGNVNLGQERWTRPYFHGGETNLDSELENAEHPKPIQKPNFSPVFIGLGPGQSLCSLSVPIEATDGSVLGVMGMTFEVGLFQPLETTGESVASKRILSIVETRGELAGVLVHHPGFKPENSKNDKPLPALPVLESGSLNQILQSRESNFTRTLNAYTDPVGGRFEGKWIAVSQPIQIKSRNGEEVKCGWHLIVQDRPYRILDKTDNEKLLIRREK